jgi:hypothetical protein
MLEKKKEVGEKSYRNNQNKYFLKKQGLQAAVEKKSKFGNWYLEAFIFSRAR